MAGLGLNIGLKALFASQSALDTIGHNLSNANTPGYSRQSLSITASRPLHLRGLGFGSGVDSEQISRTVDGLLQRRIGTQFSNFSQLDTRLSILSQVEGLFGEPGEFGLNARIEDFFSSLSSLSSTPDDQVLRVGVVQATSSLTARFNELAHNLGEMRTDVVGQVEVHVQQVNLYANEILALNYDIAEMEAVGNPANDLRDRRDMVLEKLSGLVNTRTIEGQNGAIQVTIGGQLLVGTQEVFELRVERMSDGAVQVMMQGNDKPMDMTSGSLAALMSMAEGGFFNATGAELDSLALNMILEVNRLHSTGVSQNGPFTQLTASNPLVDTDGDGVLGNELLTNAGLPFDVTAGVLQVNVTNAQTGTTETVELTIDPARTTVQGFLDDLNQLSNLSAGINNEGRVQVFADSGFGFDFAARLESNPNQAGTLGGGQASVGSLGEEPFVLADGQTLNLVGPAGAFSVTFDQTDFTSITQATAEEVVKAINAEPAMTTNGMQAVEVDGHVYIQSIGTGASESFQLAGGTAAAALGFTAGQNVTGSDNSVGVEISGSYLGEVNTSWSFVPNMNGTIGTTPGLMIDVLDPNGQLVASLDVGEGYQPGTPLLVADGVSASFDFGEVSVSDNDRMSLDLIADGDTSDVLVALGLNSLLVGDSAANIALREDIQLDPDLIAASASGAPGDNGVLLRLLDLQSDGVAGLDDRSIGAFYGSIVSGVGFETASTESALEVENVLIEGLRARRDQISGVNVDEELVNLLEFEQSFAAASQFIQVINSLNDDLLSIL